MSDLQNLVVRMLDEDNELPEEAKIVVLTAFDGAEALASMLGVQVVPSVASDEVVAEPIGAFLEQIAVTGFRGIGDRVVLKLKPRPGLTIVAGRNGSGKSSLVEALEVALTGTTFRWADKSSVKWQTAWKNLHEPDKSVIEITLAEQNVGPTKLTTTWPSGEYSSLTQTLQRSGSKAELGLAGLGWAEALATFRPLLTYDELGHLLVAGQSKLHDTISAILGLGEIATAIKTLDEANQSDAKIESQLVIQKKELLGYLAELDDPRAKTASVELKKRSPNSDERLVQLRAIASGTDHAENVRLNTLKTLSKIQLPEYSRVEMVSDEIDQSIAALAAAGSASLDTFERRVELFTAAIELHAHVGDMSCPLCEVGRLGEAQVLRIRTEVTEMSESVQDLKAARSKRENSMRSARNLVLPCPSALVAELPTELINYRNLARQAWEIWQDLPSEPQDISKHLRETTPKLIEAVQVLKQQLEPVLLAQDSIWSEAAAKIGQYSEQLASWLQIQSRFQNRKAALQWLKAAELKIKNDRLIPLTSQAKEIWQSLGQGSHVQIEDLTLEGTAKQRRLKIVSTIDGEDGGGLAVLSQGELNALTLALFLPRVTHPESPFRFTILDDPIQAMDPTKVDGLLKVLSKIAKTQQVIVFSHDDRLSAAARRGSAEADIVEVKRGDRSKVQIEESYSPVQRYLKNACALVSDKNFDDETRRRLLPGMLRMAVESQAHEQYFSNQLAKGLTLDEVEKKWSDNHETGKRVSLAIFGDTRDLNDWFQRYPIYRRALGICSSGFHDGLYGGLCGAIEDVQELVIALKGKTYKCSYCLEKKKRIND